MAMFRDKELYNILRKRAQYNSLLSPKPRPLRYLVIR